MEDPDYVTLASVVESYGLSSSRRVAFGQKPSWTRKSRTTVAAPANDPEAALQEKNRGELLRQALTRLSPEHREIIDLVYYHEKSVSARTSSVFLPPP